jgi:hypothetical protein
MKYYLQFIVSFLSGFGFAQDTAQYEAIDKKMDAIPESMATSTESIAAYISKNFATNEDKIRAAFYWTASNISYDVVAIGSKRVLTTEQRIINTLQSRKGVCMNYAYVYKDITSKLGIETVSIEGYTKSYGEISLNGHMWCASKLNGNWYLFDPTWAAGYVSKRKYVKRLDNKFYKADPKTLIVSHMPFDYLWQLSSYPISNQEFYDGKMESATKKVSLDFSKEINSHLSLSESDKAMAAAGRIEKNGLKNELIIKRWNYEKKRSEYEKNNIKYKNQKEFYDKTIKTNEKFKQANTLFTEFLQFKRRRFLPLISDESIKEKIQIPYDLVLQCQKDSNELKDVQDENQSNFNLLKNVIATSKKKMEAEIAFVNEYLSKDKSEREKMFFKKSS